MGEFTPAMPVSRIFLASGFGNITPQFLKNHAPSKATFCTREVAYFGTYREIYAASPIS